jgi:flagellar biosynthetic protein FliR
MELLLKRLGYDIDAYRVLAICGLIMARLLVAIFIAPFIGGKMVPARVKMGTAAAITIPLYYPVSQTLSGHFPIIGPFIILLLLKEAFVGLTIGLVISFVFHAVDAGGRYLDNSRGLGSAVLVAPESGAQVSLFGQLFFQMTVVLYLLIGGHLLFLEAVYDSFILIPIDRFPTIPQGFAPYLDWLLQLSAQLLVIAVKIVAPGIIAVVITDMTMGIANRVSPQINVFMLSMPIKMMVATLMIFLAFSLIVRNLDEQLLRFTMSLKKLIMMLSA